MQFCLSVFERSTVRYRAFPYFGVLNILGRIWEEALNQPRQLVPATIFPRAPIDWQRKNFPAASYQEIKNQVGDEEKAFPILV